jgi:hypothetical protein
MILKICDLAEWAKLDQVSLASLRETLLVATDIWLLKLIESAFEDKWCHTSGERDRQEVYDDMVATRVKRYNEIVRLLPTMWDYKELNGTFTCVPRDIGNAECVLSRISDRMRLIERGVIAETNDPLDLAHMATQHGPWSGWDARERAAAKLEALIATGAAGEVCGPATRV